MDHEVPIGDGFLMVHLGTEEIVRRMTSWRDYLIPIEDEKTDFVYIV